MEMSQVRVELMPGLGRYFGAEYWEHVVLRWEISNRATVRNLLEDIAAQNQELGGVIFDTKGGGLAGHISITLNGTFLDLAGGLDARLKAGDTLRLMLVVSGGS
jgi:hypothetical protein